MAITFPVGAPTNGDTFLGPDGRRYEWDSTKGRWFLQGGKALAADTKPTSPHDGEIYFNKVSGSQEVWNESTSSWVALVAAPAPTDPLLYTTPIIITGDQFPIVNEAPQYTDTVISPSAGLTQDTTTVKMGTGSINFTNTAGNYIAWSFWNQLEAFAGEWTWEAWVYPDTLPSSDIYGLFFFGNLTDNDYRYQAGINPNGSVTFYAQELAGTGESVISPTGLVSASTWTHIACTKTRLSMFLFVNGLQVAETTNLSIYNSIVTGGASNSSRLYIGAARAGGTEQNFDGKMDGIRFTNHPRYLGPFTPPTTIPLL